MICLLNLLGQKWLFLENKGFLWDNLVTSSKHFALPRSRIPENHRLKHITTMCFYKIKSYNITVACHTFCKAIMFLSKAGVCIALICAVNSYFVWYFCFYRILIFDLATLHQNVMLTV